MEASRARPMTFVLFTFLKIFQRHLLGIVLNTINLYDTSVQETRAGAIYREDRLGKTNYICLLHLFLKKIPKCLNGQELSVSLAFCKIGKHASQTLKSYLDAKMHFVSFYSPVYFYDYIKRKLCRSGGS